jgi:hypothetical protein
LKIDFITFHAHLIWQILTFIKGNVDCDFKRLPFLEEKTLKWYLKKDYAPIRKHFYVKEYAL